MKNSLIHLLGAATLLPGLLAAQTQRFGDGCPVGGRIPFLDIDRSPAPGQVFQLGVEQGPAHGLATLLVGFSRQNHGSLPLPFDLGVLGMPGCNLLCSADIVVNLPLDANGRGSIPIVAWSPGLRIYQQALFVTGPSGGGTSSALSIDPRSTQSDAFVRSMSVSAGAAGDPLTLRGFGMTGSSGTLRAQDYCVGTGSDVFFTVSSLAPDRMDLVVDPFQSGAAPGPIMLVPGHGAITPSFASSGAVFSDVWDWEGVFDESTIAITPLPFEPRESSTLATSTCRACPNSFSRSRTLEFGNLVAPLPAMCAGAKVYVRLDARWRDSSGSLRGKDLGFCVQMPCTDNAIIILSTLVLGLNTGFASHTTPMVAIPDFTNNRLTIDLLGTDFEYGGLNISVTYPPSRFTNLAGGACDDFAAPTEPTTPDAAHAAPWINAGHGAAVYDQTIVNQAWFDTINGLGTASIDGARLRIRLKALGELSSNDGIAIAAVAGGPSIWSSSISALPGTNGTWDPSQTLDLCLDLAALPTGSGTSDIRSLLTSGKLHLTVQDDTAVDCVELSIYRCQ